MTVGVGSVAVGVGVTVAVGDSDAPGVGLGVGVCVTSSVVAVGSGVAAIAVLCCPASEPVAAIPTKIAEIVSDLTVFLKLELFSRLGLTTFQA
jgi:hypothetical protein